MAYGVQQNTVTTSPFVSYLLGKAGKALTTVGTAVHAPQLMPGGLGAQMQTFGGYWQKMNPINPPAAKADTITIGPSQDNAPWNQQYTNPPPAGDGSGGQVLGLSDIGGSGDLNLTGKSWEQARADIEAQNPILDQSYNLSKGDIQAGIDQAVKQGEDQKTTVNKRYGDILANQLKTYQDLGRQRQGMFAGLGTLESSAFGEQQARADQSLAEGRTATENNNAADVKSIDDQVNSYKDAAGRELAKLALQWQAGKQQISSALANNDIQAASAIKDTIDQIRTRALTLASLFNTTSSNISGINGETYANDVAKQLAGITSSGNTLYTPATTTTQTSGFIGPDGKKYKSYADYLQNAYLS